MYSNFTEGFQQKKTANYQLFVDKGEGVLISGLVMGVGSPQVDEKIPIMNIIICKKVDKQGGGGKVDRVFFCKI